MAKGFAMCTVLALTTLAATVLTLSVYSVCWVPLEHPLVAGLMVAVVYLVWCGLMVVLGDSLIEDVVKSIILVFNGGVTLCVVPWPVPPLLGLSVLSLGVAGLVTNEVTKRVCDWLQYRAARNQTPNTTRDNGSRNS